MHSWPDTRPTPVMMPAPGASSSYMPKAASCESSRKGEPGSSSRRRRSRGSNFPRARCFACAASSPPCAARSTLARRSATSAASARAFAWNSSEPGLSFVFMAGMSPAAGGDPFVDLVQAVGAPERLAVDDDVGRAERAARDRLLHFGAGAVLDGLVGDAGADFIGLQAELRAHGDRAVGARNIDVVHAIRAGRRNRGNREDRREAIGDAVEFRAARHVARRIRSFDRYGGKRRCARRLERDAEQERPPSHLAAVFRGERVDFFARDIAVRRGEVEVELDRARHHAISIAMAVASPPPMQRLAIPRLPPVFRSAPIKVTRMRAPDAPIGWPSAQAPPWTLTFSCGSPCSFIAAMVTTAKASLISDRKST